jgi:hypothetical protein
VLLENGQVVVMVGDAEGTLLDIEAVRLVMVDVTVKVDVGLGLGQFQSWFIHEQYIHRAGSDHGFIAVAC